MEKKKQYKNPTIDLTKLEFSGSGYVAEGNKWSAATLVQYCKEQNYPVFKLPVAAVDTSFLPFKVRNLDEFMWQMNRVNKADLNYPIILDAYGRIADGCHRFCKAVISGKTEIDAIRIQTMPTPDGKDETYETKN